MTNNENGPLLSIIMSLPPQKQEQLWAELVARGIISEEAQHENHMETR